MLGIVILPKVLELGLEIDLVFVPEIFVQFEILVQLETYIHSEVEDGPELVFHSEILVLLETYIHSQVEDGPELVFHSEILVLLELQIHPQVEHCTHSQKILDPDEKVSHCYYCLYSL